MTKVAQVSADTDRDVSASVRPGFFGRVWVQRTIVWGALILLYELAAMAVGPFFMPRLSSIVSAYAGMVEDGYLVIIGRSLRQLGVGFGLAIVFGIAVGMLMGASRYVDYVVGMYVKALFVTSLVALLPLLIIFVGVDFEFRVIVVFLFSVFFIILNTAAGVRNVDRSLLWTARAFMASPWRQFVSVRLPASLPFVVAGMRLGLANAFSGMILAELWVIRDTGELLIHLGLSRNLPRFFALVVLITAMAGFSAAILKVIEKRLLLRGDR